MEKIKKLDFLSKMKISSKLTLLYSSMVALILLVFVACTIFSVYIYGNINSEQVLTHAASSIVNNIAAKSDLFDKNWDDVTIGNNLYVVIYSENREILRLPDGLSSDDDLIEDAEFELFNEVFRSDFFDDAAYINRKIMVENEVFIVQVIKDYRSELYMIAFMSATLGVFLILGTLFSVLIGRKMSEQMLKPIGTMTENANNIQHGLSSERLVVADKKDELSNLGNTLNAMLDRIESNSHALTQFVSDASHELRTPITVILSYAEMLKKWAKEDKDILDKSIDSIEKEALNMKILTDRLLTLAKSDSKNLVLHNERFELSDLIDEIFEETTIIAENRQITLLKNDKLALESDKNRLKELLRIIIDNAVKYTKENGTVEISSTVSQSKLEIAIKDNGIGIKQCDLNKIFDRFFCSEISRNKKRSGSGLGLSIAKALAVELGFEISVKSQEGVYTEFVVSKDFLSKQ